MSDFMLWLHANYIQPQIDAVEKDEYEFHFHLVEKALSTANCVNLKHALEFTAIQAFLLSFRTSEGLTPRTPWRHVIPVKRNGQNAD